MSDSNEKEIEYPEENLSIFEAIWGKGFVSPGGPNEIAELLRNIDLTNLRVLDIGCGTGGIDIILVRDYGAKHVVGIDVEKPVLEAAQSNVLQAGLSEQITLQLVSPGPFPFDDNSFDIVFSKDALLHIPDKSALFTEVLRVLQTGGRFVASDWLRGEYDVLSEKMGAFLKLSGHEFDMVTLGSYESRLREAGFTEVALRDRNSWYREEAKHELELLRGPLKQEIINKLGREKSEEYEQSWVAFWEAMVEVLKSGELRPAHIMASKIEARRNVNVR